MITQDKQYIVTSNGKTYRFSSDDWAARRDRFMELNPEADIAEVDRYSVDDAQDGDTIVARVDGKTYSFDKADWDNRGQSFMEKYSTADLSRVRGVDYYYDQAIATEGALEEAKKEKEAWAANRKTGMSSASLADMKMLEAGLTPISRMDDNNMAAAQAYLDEGRAIDEKIAALQQQYDNNPRVKAAKEAWEKQNIDYTQSLLDEVSAKKKQYETADVAGETLHRQAMLMGSDSDLSYITGTNKPAATTDKLSYDKLGAAENFLEKAKQIRTGEATTFWSGFGNPYEEDIKSKMYQSDAKSYTEVALLLKRLNDEIGSLNDLTAEDIDEHLNEEDKYLLKAFLEYSDAEASGKKGWKYTAGEIGGESLKFALEFMATSGISGGIAKSITKGLQLGLKRWAKKAAVGTARRVARNVATKAVDLATRGALKAAIMTMTRPSTYTTIAKALPTIDEEGNVKLGKNAAEGAYDAFAESVSELSGGAISKVLGVPFKWVKNTSAAKAFSRSFGSTKFGAWGKKIWQGSFGNYAKAAGFEGAPIEVLEEYVGNAMRLPINPNAIKEMHEGDNFASMLLGFVPMTVLGGGISAASLGFATRRARQSASALRDMLINKGFADSKVSFITDINREHSPVELGVEVYNLKKELERRGATQEELQLLGDYSVALAEYQTVRGGMDAMKAQEKSDVLKEIEAQYQGTKIFQTNAEGNETVTWGETNDGKQVFITSERTPNGEYAAVDRLTGKTMFVSEQEIKESQTSSLDAYLEHVLMGKRQVADVERMLQERQEQINELSDLLPSKLNLGTEGTPKMVAVKSKDGKGVTVVDEQGDEAVLSWDIVAQKLGTPIESKTSEEITEAEIEALSLSRAEKKASIAKTKEQMDAAEKAIADTNAEIKELTPNPEEEYRDPNTGEIDQDAFWEHNPEGWADYNDRVMNDGGIDTMEQIENGLAKLNKQKAELDKMAIDSPIERKAVKAKRVELQEKIDRLTALQQKYNEMFAAAEQEAIPEEERVAENTIAMREVIEGWRNQYGVPIHVYESKDEVVDAGEFAARAQIEVAETPGWSNSKGVHLFLPDIKSMDKLRETLQHELIAHQGFKLLGEKEYNALMDKIWAIMSDSAKTTFYNYPSAVSAKNLDERRRKAAEEFAAHVAEKVDLGEATAEQKSIWQRIMEFFRNLFKGQEVDSQLIANAIRQNHEALKQKAAQESLDEFKAEAQDQAQENIISEEVEETAPVETITNIADAARQDPDAIDLSDGNMYSTKTEDYLASRIREYASSKEGKKAGWNKDNIEEIIEETQDLITAIHNASTGNEFYDEFAAKDPTFRLDWRDGQTKPIVTWTRANIEYKYDMSADLLCVNNEGLEEVLSSEQMVELMRLFNPSKLDEVTTKDLKGKEHTQKIEIGFSQDDYLELYNTLKDLGFVVPCKGCFDAAGRFKMLPSVAHKFAAAVNAVIDERNADPEAFDNTLKSKAKKNATIGGLPSAASTKLDAIRAGVAGDNLTEHIKWTQLMSADGQTKMLSDWGGIFRAWQRTGAGRPKDKLLPEPYYGDIVSQQTTIIGKYGEKTPSFKDILVNTGTGLRRNSHSEFRPVLAVDEIQFMRDAFIKNLTVFKYMKELDDVRLFGKMGVKFNMSFFPEYVPGTKAAGLDLDGNYIPSEESVGAREFPYIGEDGKRHYDGKKGWQEAQKHINKDVSLSSVILSIPHLIKALTDVPTTSDKSGIWGSLIPFHSSGATSASLYLQGLGRARANGAGHGFEEALTRYGEGVTNFEAVQNDRFGKGWVIVEGKKAGEAVEDGHKLEFANGNHYYNKEMGLHLFASMYIQDSELPEGALNEDGTINLSDKEKKAIGHSYEIDYNNKVREIGTPTAYKEAADFYLEFLPKIGLKPRFDFEVPEDVFLQMCADANVDPSHHKLGWKGTGNSWSPIDSEAYYSLFCDYGMTDPATGEWAPHNPVGYIDENGERVFRMPDNTVEIIKEGLDRYSNIRKSESAKIDEAIKEFAKRSVAKGRISQEAVDSVLGEDTNMFKTRITPEQDAAYLKAVEAGDMETAQRMVIEAAKIAMPNTKVVDENGNPKVVYHGTNLSAANKGVPFWSFYEDQHFGTKAQAEEMARAGKPDAVRKVYSVFLNVPNIKRVKDAPQDWIKTHSEYWEPIFDEAKQEGYDGLVYVNEWEDSDNKNDSYVAFNPSQIKSADPVTYDDEGNVIPLSERFNEEKEDIRFKTANKNQAIFVSNAAKAVEVIKMEKATPEQWLKMIEKNGGLKAGEDKWMGLSDFLKASDKKTLTKQEVLDFINENMIQIEEQHYSNEEMGKASVKILNKQYQGWEDAFSFEWDGYMEDPSADISDYEAAVELYNKHHDDKVALDEDGEFEDMDTYEKVRQFGVELSEIYHGSKSEVRAIDGTREQYTTQGLQHLHEIALTVPTIESWGLGGSNTVHFEDAGDGRAVAWIRFGETQKLLGTTEVDGKKKFNWAKVLVIDEIQSKRHQEGREKGYRVSDIEQWLSDNNVEVVESGEFYEFIKNGETDRRFSKGLMNYDIEKAKRLYVSGYNKSDIPDAPFDKNWHELAMKRMLRYAAENGYDVIAWTKGDQQAERYNIGGVISEIKATKYPRGYEVVSFGKNGSVVHNEVFAEESAMAEVYGKEMSQRIIESVDALEPSETATISGDNLRVGGEGMKGFYDRMLPAFMNKYGKKWGVKVEDIHLNLENGLDMHSVPVTEEMKASVMEGQVMFKTSAANNKSPEFSLPNELFLDDPIMFKVSRNNRQTISNWLNKRPDLNDEAKAEVLDYLDQFNDATLQLAVGKWYAQNAIKLPEDIEKCMQAVASAKKAKIDALKFASPMEIINEYGVIEPKAKPINPDKVSTLSKVRDLSNGISIYDVENSEESRKNMREIINTHYGKNCSPWCILQGDENGKLTAKSQEYWRHYNGYPKQVAFKDGKLLAFSANDSEETAWWDRMDKSYSGVPVNQKIGNDKLGRTRTVEFDQESGKEIKVHGIKKVVSKDGIRREWAWRSEKEDDIVRYGMFNDRAEMVEGFDKGSWNLPNFLVGLVPKNQIRFIKTDDGRQMIFNHFGGLIKYDSDHISFVDRFTDADITGVWSNGNQYKFRRNGKLLEFSDANLNTYEGKDAAPFQEQANEVWKQVQDIRKNAKSIANEMLDSMEYDPIMFSTIGERGASRDNSEEGLIRLNNLEIARQMEAELSPDWMAKDDENALKIKVATGWERGTDGKWRYEVEDIKIKPIKDWLFSKKKLKLRDIVKDGELLRLYPDLGDIDIVKMRGKDDFGAAYIHIENKMELPFAALKDAYKWSFFEKGALEMYSDIIHEVQHAIQRREGFAKGGNENMPHPYYKETYDDLFEQMKKLAGIYNSMTVTEQASPYGVQIRDSYNAASRNRKQYTLGKRGYKRLAGETEARNAEARRNMSMEERRKSLLASTEDVARKDQIILLDAIQEKESNNLFKTEITPEVRSEMNTISAQAIVNGTYLKAPNGKDTNLTPEQWALVRTKNFKRWFGDWEQLSELKEIEARKVEWLSAENIAWAKGKTLQEIEAKFGNEPKAVAYLPVEYLSVFGEEAANLADNRVYSGKGYYIDHAANHHHAVSLEKYINIQEVINNYDHLKRMQIDGHESIVFIKKIDRWNAVSVQLEVGENGRIVWHKSFYDQKKEPYKSLPDVQLPKIVSPEGGVSSISPTENSVAAISLQSRDDNAKLVNFLNPTNISKVVDENGEPMVVYHGSPYGSITTFDRKGRTQSGLKEFGTYFTTNKKLAELYAYARQQAKKDIEAYEAEKEKLDAIIFNPDTPARIALDAFDELDKLNESQKPRVYEVFLNIKQPKVFDAEGKDGWNGWHKLKQDVGYDIKYGTEAIEAIAGHNRAARMDQSYDGIIAKNIADIHSDEVADYLGDVFLVFDENPNQIKSATDNTGEFSESDEDIRFKTRTKPAPTKTQEVYKLMRLGADGKLYPLFIGSAEPIELGTWYDAESPNLGDLTKLASGVHLVNNETGEAMTLDEFKAQHPEINIKGKRPNVAAINWATENGARWIEIEDKSTAQRRYEGESRSYYNLGINGSGQVGQFAMRPGWHAGSLPTMRQIGKGKDKNLRDDSFVWVKGRIPADVDYQSEADANPDKDIPTHIPTDGFYMKATNANAKASQADKMGWYVAGSFVADEIISDAEARSVIDSWNAEHPDAKVEYDYPRESGREFDPARGGLVESEDIMFKTYGKPTEAVVDDGLRLSVEDFTKLASDIYTALPVEVRRQVVQDASRIGYDLKKATFQMVARLAEKKRMSDDEIAVAKIVADKVEKSILANGEEMTRPLTVNEALWMVYRASNPTSRYDLIGAARNSVVADNLGQLPKQKAESKRAKDDIMFKTEYVPEQAASAAEAYEKAVSYWGNRINESFVDQYDSVDHLMRAIEEATGKPAESSEDIRLALYQSASRGLAKLKEVERDLIQNMWDAVNALAKEGASHETLSRYVILKHGLERNDIFAARDARKEYESELRDKLRRINNDSSLTEQEKEEKMDEAMQEYKDHLKDIDEKVDEKYLENRKTDYSGIKAMFADYPDLKSEDQYSTNEEYKTARRLARRLRYKNLDKAEAEAQRECDAFEMNNGDLVKNLWDSINNLTRGTLKMQQDYGMLSQESYDSLTNMFNYYVPLRGFADNTGEDLYDYYGHNVSDGYAPAIMGAKGRRSEAESPFGWMAAMAATAVISGEKNLVKQALYNFAVNRPNDILKVSDVWYLQNPTDGKFYPEYPPKADSSKTPAENAEAYLAWENKMEELAKQGKAVKRSNNLHVAEVVNFGKKDIPEHVIRLNVGGMEKHLIINGHPRAAQAINGLLNVETDPDYQKGFGRMLRWMSQVSTSWNPEFWITNIMRDSITAFLSTAIEEDKEYRRAFRKNWGKAWKVIKLLPQLENGTLGNGKIEDLLREAVANGVQTGYSHIKSMEEWDKQMDKYLKDLNKEESKVIHAMKTGLHAVQQFSEAMELVSRFATYMTSREMGRDIPRSVSDAKEVTVNFNRKGSGKKITIEEAKKLRWKSGNPIFSEKWTGFKRLMGLASVAYVSGISFVAPYGRRALLFFNAAIQGLNKWVRSIRKGHGGKVALTAGAAVLLGFLKAVLQGMLDGDDDYQQNVSEYERRKNLMLGARGWFFKIALPQEIATFYGLGDMLYNWVSGNYHHKDGWEKIKMPFEQLFDMLPINPLGGAKEFAPSYSRAAIEAGFATPWEDYWGTGSNFAGMPLRKDMPWLTDAEKESLPKYTFAGEGTWEWLVSLSELANDISGGTEVEKGWLQIDPARWQSWISQLSGGLGTFLGKVVNTGKYLVNHDEGDYWKISQTPFLSRILTATDERLTESLTNEQFYHYKGIAEASEMRWQKYSVAGNESARTKEEGSDEYKILQIYNESFRGNEENFAYQLKTARDENEEFSIRLQMYNNRKLFVERLEKEGLI